MRFVALVLAITIGAVGFVSVGTAQAHGGDGGGAIEVMDGYATCPVVSNVQALSRDVACVDVLDAGNHQ